MAKKRNNKHIHTSFTQRLSDDNVMPDGMLDSISKTEMAILPIALNAPEGKIAHEKDGNKEDENR